MANPTAASSYYRPLVRLEYDVDPDPPKLYCFCSIWVPANKTLAGIAGALSSITHIRYTIGNGTITEDHWEHFEFSWNWPDYNTEKIIINIVTGQAKSIDSSDRAEPYG